MAIPLRPKNSKAQRSFAQSFGGASSLIHQDPTVISALFDAIDRDPPAIEARVLLMQQWLNLGMLDAAEDAANDLLRVDPSNTEAQRFLYDQKKSVEISTPKSNSSLGRQGVVSVKNGECTPLQAGPLPRTSDERAAMERELSQGHEELRARAIILLQESRLVQDLKQREHILTEPDSHVQNLKALVDGRMSAVVASRPPRSARAVARAMEADPDRALGIAVDDFADMVRWLRGSTNTIDNDALRESLVKRVRALIAALPHVLQQLPSVALMHIEHEELNRTYLNQETMLLEPVADIPRANFWVSEDGFAWDMDELAKCLASNGGVMRNPLSHHMFSLDDVRAIVQHPLGKHLQAMQLEQNSLFKGIRLATIDKLDQLSTILLNDLSDDQVPSREAIDDFLQYIITLPQSEQRAIDTLRVPATDSHTGQAFDCTIGEAVRDGKANKICLHKTGDLIGQASSYLRQGSLRVND